MLSRYPTSLEEDEAALKGVDALPPRRAAALVARTGEKRCLHAFLKVGGSAHAHAHAHGYAALFSSMRMHTVLCLSMRMHTVPCHSSALAWQPHTV